MSVVPLHRDRAVTIGGSDAAAAVGLDPYKSRVGLWLEKTGRHERPETDAMRWGKRIEPVVFAALADDGYDVEHRAGALTDPARSWLSGTPDGFVQLDGGLGVLEVKTANSFAHRANGDGPALHYVAQIQHYLHLTGLQRALLATLVNGQHLETVEVARDQAFIDRLLDYEERFHWHVVTDTQPPHPTREDLLVLHPEAAPKRRARADAALMRTVKERRARHEQLKAVKAQLETLDAAIMAAMGEAEVLVSPQDDEVARWQTVTSHRLDQKAFKAQRPELASLFTTTTTTRRLTVL